MESLMVNTNRILNIFSCAVRGLIIYKIIVDLIWFGIKRSQIKNYELKKAIIEVAKKEEDKKSYNDVENIILNQIDTDFATKPKQPKVTQPVITNQYISNYHIKKKPAEILKIEKKVILPNSSEPVVRKVDKTKIRKIRRKTVSLILARLLGSSRKSKQKEIISSKNEKKELNTLTSIEGKRMMFKIK